jgi:hypothetical protein
MHACPLVTRIFHATGRLPLSGEHLISVRRADDRTVCRKFSHSRCLTTLAPQPHKAAYRSHVPWSVRFDRIFRNEGVLMIVGRALLGIVIGTAAAWAFVPAETAQAVIAVALPLVAALTAWYGGREMGGKC